MHNLANGLTLAENNALGGTNVNPHPDGKPWAKCCTSGQDNDRGCQCFMKKPRNTKSRFDKFVEFGSTVVLALLSKKGRFFCCHRKTEDGFHRECAGWAAKITGNK